MREGSMIYDQFSQKVAHCVGVSVLLFVGIVVRVRYPVVSNCLNNPSSLIPGMPIPVPTAVVPPAPPCASTTEGGCLRMSHVTKGVLLLGRGG